ncbi:MAG: class I SAM-dependent methyltransferase [Elusimicrobiales bacterium]|nr:class I SAM-dependent methyltransferase [Elusimicrobiales bacterium]
MTTKDKRDIFSRRHVTPETAAYFGALTAPDEGYAAHVLAAMEAAGVRGLAVSPMEGRILETFARLSGARKAVEIGTLYGYSAHWLARGLADGARLYSLEKEPACVNAAKDAVEASGLTRKVTVMEGPALDNLKTLGKLAPFDLCFIDADAENYPAYLRWAAANLRPGGVLLADGAFLKGGLCAGGGEPADGPGARAMREFFHILFDGDRFVSAAVLPTGEGLAAGIKA